MFFTFFLFCCHCILSIDIRLTLQFNSTNAIVFNVIFISVSDRITTRSHNWSIVFFSGETIEAKTHNDVTMLFSDIVGFTSICSTATPMMVINMLQNLYNQFDVFCGQIDVYKVNLEYAEFQNIWLRNFKFLYFILIRYLPHSFIKIQFSPEKQVIFKKGALLFQLHVLEFVGYL